MDEEKAKWFCPECNGVPAETVGGNFRVISTDDWNFRVLETRAALERRKFVEDALLKYGPMIGLALVVVLFIITIYFSYNYIKDVAGMSCKAMTTPTQPATVPQILPGATNLLKP
jgi:hypothetical protein